MKIKQYIKESPIILLIIIIFGATAFITNSCTDLEEEVYTELMAEDFEPREGDIASMLAPVYSAKRGLYFGWHGYFDFNEESSDIIVTPARPNGWVDGGVYRRMHLHTWTSEQSHVGGVWWSAFSGINSANRVYHQFEQDRPDLGERKENILAEIRVARAYYYYILLDAIGNVPIVTEWDVEEDFLPEQNTRQEVFDFIIEEVNEALPYLAETADMSNYGRWTKWAAKALLARVYLNAEVYVGEAMWDEVITQCDDIIASGEYILESDYSAPFAFDNTGSPELVMAVPFDDLHGPWFHLHMKTLHPQNQATYNIEGAPWGGNAAIPQFIDTYHPDDTRLDDTWIKGQQFSSAGDTLYCNLGDDMMDEPLEFVNEMGDVYYAAEHEGYRIGKFEIPMGALGMLPNDFPVFRYADILMMKAEALLRQGNANEAATYVTQVRERAFKDNPAAAEVTGDELMQGSSYNYGVIEEGEMIYEEGGDDIVYGRFLDELGWEFAAEARRRTDLIRFDAFTTKPRLSFEGSEEYRRLMPVPEGQMETNPNLEQNPGY